MKKTNIEYLASFIRSYPTVSIAIYDHNVRLIECLYVLITSVGPDDFENMISKSESLNILDFCKS